MKNSCIITAEVETFEKSAEIGFAVRPEIICFVSKDDVCRGPVCAAVFNKLSGGENGIRKAFSCGVDVSRGRPISFLAADALITAGYIGKDEVSSFFSRPASRAVLENSDIIAAVDENTAMKLMIGFPGLASRIRCFSEDITPPGSETSGEYRRIIVEAEDRIRQMFGFDRGH